MLAVFACFSLSHGFALPAFLYIFLEKRDPTAVKRENPPTATLLEMLRNKLDVLTQSINLILIYHEKTG